MPPKKIILHHSKLETPQNSSNELGAITAPTNTDKNPSGDLAQSSTSVDNFAAAAFSSASRSLNGNPATSSDEDEMAPEGSSNNANASKQPAAGAGGSTTGGANGNGEAGIPFYEAQRKSLLKLMEKRRKVAERLAQREETIEQKETEYLESTPAGNILTGFDNYTKGTSQAAAAQRRKAGPLDQHRVFSRSSLSYNPNNAAASSGEESGSATPLSASFAPTPTSAGGAAKARSKKKAPATETGGESESDAREVKKVRANFGASSSRK